MEGHHKTELKKKNQKKIIIIFFFLNSSGRAAGIFGTVVNPALMMNDLQLASYMTKKGSDDVRYFLLKKRQK